MKKAISTIIVLAFMLVSMSGCVLGKKSISQGEKGLTSTEDAEKKHTELTEITTPEPEEQIGSESELITSEPTIQTEVPEADVPPTTEASVNLEDETAPSQTDKTQETTPSGEDTKPVYEGDSPLDAGEF